MGSVRNTLLLGVVCLSAAYGQSTVYFDVNGTTAGSGVTDGSFYAWNANLWSTSSAGTAATGAWSGTTDTAVFSAGTDATGDTYTVFLGTTQTVGGITVEEGSLTLSSGTLALGQAAIFNIGQNTTIAAPISGAFGITKSGTGTLSLTTANTYTGTTTLSAGTVAITNATALGTTAGGTTVGGSATLDLQNVTGVAEGLSLAGTLATSTGTSSASGNIALTGDANFDVGGTQLSLSGIISGNSTRDIDKTGTGTLLLSGANTYEGSTTVSAGTLAVTHATALGTTDESTIVNSGATLDLQNVTVAEDVILLGGILSTSTGTSSASDEVIFGSDSTIDVDGTQLSLTGIVSGTGGFDKTGTGTLALSGANTYTGATTLSAGTVEITHATALGTTAAGTTINSGATLDLQNITGVAEDLTLNGGTLATSTGTSSVTGGVNMSAASTVDVDGTQLSLNGSLSGAGNLQKTGTGTLVLGANNFGYTGDIDVTAGTLELGHGGATDFNNAIAISAGATVEATASLVAIGPLSGAGDLILSSGGDALIYQDGGVDSEFSGVISGTGGVQIREFANPVGTLTLSGANTYTGKTQVGDDTSLAITNVNALGAVGTAFDDTEVSGRLDIQNVTGVAENIQINRGTLATSTGTSSVTGDIVISDNGFIDVTGTQLTLSGVISGGVGTEFPGFGGFEKTGTGTLLLTGANTTAGSITVSAGTLAITHATGLGGGVDGFTPGSTTVSSGATLDVRNATGVAENLVLNGGTLLTSTGTSSVSGDISLQANSTIVVGGTQLTLSGVISGTSGIDKTGTSILTLTGANTFTGDTNVSAGTLQLTAANTIAVASDIIVDAGATLFIDANQSINSLSGAGTLELAGGTLTLAANSSIGTLHITGDSAIDFGSNDFSATNFLIDAGVTLTVNNEFVASNWWADSVGGTLVLRSTNGTTPYNQVQITGIPAATDGSHTGWNNDDFVTAVPEPRSYGALLIGGMLAFIYTRRSRRTREPRLSAHDER